MNVIGVRRARQVARLAGWSAAVAGLALCLGSLHIFARGLDRVSRDLRLEAAPEATLVYDRHNNLVFSFASEDRTTVTLDRISPSMVAAVLTAEDRRFFRHAGMDLIGIARALWVDVRAQAIKQGGSTITQQLIRQVALTADRDLARKVKEAFLAVRVERRFEKSEILEAYLNRIYLGSGHYGVEAAARGYFGKSASQLDVAESALLAGLVPCPSLCSPRVALNIARSRRDTILAAMRDNGAITPEQHREAIRRPIELAPRRHDPYITTAHSDEAHAAEGTVGLHFLEAVRRQIMEQFGADEVLRGGLRIYTTLDVAVQRHAEEAVRARLQQLDRTGKLEGALVAIAPPTGEVLALVGGRDFHHSSFNRAIQARRQPGSAFKPLLFAAAIEQGYAPGEIVADAGRPVQTPQGAWLPADEHQDGEYTLRQALAISSNRAAVRVMQMVGISTTQMYARRLGITSSLPAVPSLALGTGEVTLLDLTSAYSAFANGGIVSSPTMITRIADRSGNVIWRSDLEQRPHRAIRPGTAYIMSSMMADVINRGTGSRARGEGFRLPAAGKTGTTDDYGDAWFVGYTPHLAAGVWFGFDERKPIMNRGFAGTVAVPAWARFMMKATAGDKPDWFDMPQDVERVAVCRRSGQRAAAACRHDSETGEANVYEDLFLRGTGPYETCVDAHTSPPPAAAPTTVLSAVF